MNFSALKPLGISLATHILRKRMIRRSYKAFGGPEVVIFRSRRDAQEVLGHLKLFIEEFGSVTVADLYSLSEIQHGYLDSRCGWYSLRGTKVLRVRNGYILDLPKTKPID